MFLLYADKNKLAVRQREPVTSGSVNVYTARFKFSPDWTGLTAKAVFRGGGITKTVLLDGGECVIPWEVLASHGQPLMAGVFGMQDDAALPTTWASLGTILEGAPGDAEGTKPPTPDAWEQELDKKQDKLSGRPDQLVGFDDEGNAVAKDAGEATQGPPGPEGPPGPKGDTGPQGEIGPAGPKGDQGETGPQGPKGDKGDPGGRGPAGPKGDTGEQGPPGVDGESGADGATFTPAVSADGTLSWTNNGGLPNPEPVNIKGPPGEDADGVTMEQVGEAIGAAVSTKQSKLTGARGQVVGFGADGAAQAVRGWSNQGLLINGDFRRPVNRNGKMVYTGNGYTIDCWKIGAANMSVSLTDDGIVVKNTGEDAAPFVQYFETKDIPHNGETYTVSAMVDGQLHSVHMEHAAIGMYCSFEYGGGNYFIFHIQDAATSYMAFYLTAGAEKKLLAAKLELGPVQTLAHQDADGGWVLNDPPDYALQYALCSLYSPITGEWVGNQHSNPNLLDNWYFADPINQRGQTEYIGNADPIYTLDRWKLAGLSTSNTKLELVDGGVRITSGNVFCQIVENNVTRALIGKTVTVSALMDIEIPPVAGQLGIVADNAWIGSTPLPATTGTDILVSATISISNVSTLIPWIYSAPGGVYKLKAIKLELGPVQTLAHQDVDGSWVLNDPPPNKALELAKCQRYQYATSSYYGVGEVDGEGINIGVNFPCTMRSTPTMQTKTGIKAQMAGYGGSGFYENLTVSFRWGSPTSCVVLINVPDPSKFVMGRPVTARIDTPLLFDANL